MTTRRTPGDRRVGNRAAYVRQRGFEPLQQEQMVLQCAQKHGRITRRDAAEPCCTGISGAGSLPIAFRTSGLRTENEFS